jgi:carbon monoxide dehydrogenase subunit G
MHLAFSGSPVVQATRLQVWLRLLDPTFLAQSVPGVESTEPLDSTHFEWFPGLELVGSKFVLRRRSCSPTLKGAIAAAGSRVLKAFTNRLTTHFWTDFARRVSDPLASYRKVEILSL